MKNLYDHITTLAASQPKRPALIACDTRGVVIQEISYGELPTRIASAAGYLQSLGLLPGERVALALGTTLEQLIVSWAAWSMGVVTVPLDTKHDTKELAAYKLSAAEAHTVLRELPDAPPFKDAWMSGTAHEALILYTSGTTGHPKGAKLTLENLLVNAEGIREWLQVTSSDRFLVQLPLHHINSTTFCLTTLLAGGTVVVPPAYSNSGFWMLCAKTEATFTSIVQSILFDQLSRRAEFAEHKKALKLSRIQIGSAPVMPTTVTEFIEQFDIPLYQGYGQTETALRVTGVPMGLNADVYKQMIVQNSIGTPMPWAEVEVTDEQGRILAEGQEGELLVKGGAVMSGYVAGEEAFRDGYFLTGDIGLWRTVEGKRFFFLTGRKKEIIIKGGVNISPVAVENALQQISPDVAQAYVVGVEDERYGEVPAVALCWKSGAVPYAVMRQLKTKLLFGTERLSAYETPDYVTTFSEADLPKTSTGKVQRSLLKELVPAWEPITELFATNAHRFLIVKPFSQYAEASHALYNHCWQPLTQTPEEYRNYLATNHTLAAVDATGTLAGQITFKKEGDVLVCLSICSAKYLPKPVPEITTVPLEALVREYVFAGKDPVINFHLGLGAQVIEVIPNGRPEDKSALGYMVRLRYAVPDAPVVDASVPVSRQLIQATLLLAHDLGLAHVDALSRPGGLAAYMSGTTR